MTLDEAIEHANEISVTDCTECAKEHGQLADWLKELSGFRNRMKYTSWKMYYQSGNAMIECSVCGFNMEWQDKGIEFGEAYHKQPFRYCPMCGAKSKL